MPEPEKEIDENEGKGGSYVIGEDGKRVLVERTTPADTSAPAAQIISEKQGE
jgi:hypothetical protein